MAKQFKGEYYRNAKQRKQAKENAFVDKESGKWVSTAGLTKHTKQSMSWTNKGVELK